MDFGFISTPFFDICLYLSVPLVLVIFDNHSIRKRVSCKSEGLKFGTFPTCFVDFVSSSFFIRFSEIFEAILDSIWHHFWEKNPSENRFKKRAPPKWKRVIMHMSRGSQRGRLLLFFIKATASRAHFSNRNNSSSSNSSSISARARIVVRICVQVWVDCNSKSKNCSKMAAWVGFDCKSFENNSKKWKGWYQNSMLVIWHATGQKPGELEIEKITLFSVD